MIKFIKSEEFILPIVYIILGMVIYNLVKMIIGKVSKNKLVDKKKVTIISLIKNIIKYLVMIFVVLAILDVYGVNTTSVIASIGVVGVVIGLAFQDIVADFLAGVYILFDNQYTIGDTVLIDDFLGKVISFGLMSTKVKGVNGEVMTISNASFKKVINYSMNNYCMYLDFNVSYDTDIEALEKVLEDMRKEVIKIDGVVGEYKILGLSSFDKSGLQYKVSLESKWEEHYRVEREFNKILFKYLRDAGIEIPYEKVDIYMRGK